MRFRSPHMLPESGSAHMSYIIKIEDRRAALMMNDGSEWVAVWPLSPCTASMSLETWLVHILNTVRR